LNNLDLLTRNTAEMKYTAQSSQQTKSAAPSVSDSLWAKLQPTLTD